jgi:putative membrane protein
MEFSGLNGFLGTRASFMLDVVFLAMFAVMPVLIWSVWLVRYRQNFLWHKRLQLLLAAVLGVTVAIFEIDIRLHGWRDRAEASPYYGTPSEYGPLFTVLSIHLCFAVSTSVLWTVVIYRALRRFPSSPGPSEHSASHIFWARLAAVDMGLTTVTGWTFYYLAFVA